METDTRGTNGGRESVCWGGGGGCTKMGGVWNKLCNSIKVYPQIDSDKYLKDALTLEKEDKWSLLSSWSTVYSIKFSNTLIIQQGKFNAEHIQYPATFSYWHTGNKL